MCKSRKCPTMSQKSHSYCCLVSNVSIGKYPNSDTSAPKKVPDTKAVVIIVASVFFFQHHLNDCLSLLLSIVMTIHYTVYTFFQPSRSSNKGGYLRDGKRRWAFFTASVAVWAISFLLLLSNDRLYSAIVAWSWTLVAVGF